MEGNPVPGRSSKNVATGATTAQLPQRPIGAKISDSGSSSVKIPNLMKPTSAASQRRHGSFYHRTAGRHDVLSSPPSPSRPTLSLAQLNLSSNTKNLHPAETDAGRTRRLWDRVMADKRSGATRPTQASRAKEKKLLMRDDSGIGSSAGAPSRITTTSSLTGSALTTTNSEARLAKVGEQGFEKIVLNPRGIHVTDSTKSTLASFHFGTGEAPSEEPYRILPQPPGLSETTLWLDGNESFLTNIVRGYDSLKEDEVNEAEYAMFAMENLLKSEVRNPRLPETRRWMAERMIQLVAKPEELWEQPPIIDANVPRKAYNFDIRPDCSY